MNKTIIAIDPDLHKSGVSTFENGILTQCEALPIWDLFLYLLNEKNLGEEYEVLLEAGHKIKSCWHSGGRGAASNTGKGKAVGILIEHFLEKKNINFRLIKPKGYSKYFKEIKFFQLQTGWTKRTNEDMRASAAIGFFNK